MTAFHGTTADRKPSILQEGLKSPAYFTLELEVAEEFASIRAKERGLSPLLVTLEIADNFYQSYVEPDPNSDDDDEIESFVSKESIGPKSIKDVEVLNVL